MNLKWRSARAAVMGAAMTMIAANVAIGLPALSSSHMAAHGGHGLTLDNALKSSALGTVGRLASRLVELANGSGFTGNDHRYFVLAGDGPRGKKEHKGPRDRRSPYQPPTRQLPEPGSLWILGAGLTALGIAGSRLRRP